MAAFVHPAPVRAGRILGRLTATAVVAVVAVIAGPHLVGLLPWANPFGSTTVDRSEPAVLQAVADLSEYRAATGNYSIVVDIEKDARYLPSVVAGERTVFVAAGDVDAFVDFSDVGPGTVAVSPDRTAVTFTLPAARLGDVRIDAERSRVAARDRGVLNRIGSVFSDSPTSDRPLYVASERKMMAAAEADDSLLRRAEANTATMLRRLLEPLGFTTVEVRFAPPAPTG